MAGNISSNRSTRTAITLAHLGHEPNLPQPGVLGLGLLKDGDVGVGVFPESEDAKALTYEGTLSRNLFYGASRSKA